MGAKAQTGAQAGAQTGWVFAAMAAAALAPTAAEAREVLVCRPSGVPCAPLEALAPAYFQDRTVRMDEADVSQAPLNANAAVSYRDYYFAADGYFTRSGAAVAFHPAQLDGQGRLCLEHDVAAHCVYLVRAAPGPNAAEALCFAEQADGQPTATLTQCAIGEWGGDRFSLRAGAIAANLTPAAAVANPAPSANSTCAYVMHASGGYSLECDSRSARRERAGEPVSVQRASAAPAPSGAQDGCSYTMRPDGGYEFDCVASPNAASQPPEPRRDHGWRPSLGMFAFWRGFRSSAHASAVAMITDPPGAGALSAPPAAPPARTAIDPLSENLASAPPRPASYAAVADEQAAEFRPARGPLACAYVHHGDGYVLQCGSGTPVSASPRR